MIPQNAKIYVAGHQGLVGSAVMRKLKSLGYTHLITRSSSELDLTQHSQVKYFFAQERPAYVLLCAAKVGGILANASFPGDFIYQNLLIQTHVIHEAKEQQVKRLIFLGSSCIYPRDCPQPIKEEYLLTGPLEPTNRPYALAKISGIEMCWAYNRQFGTSFVCAMPTNLYGPGDRYDLHHSHVLPALLLKMHRAKKEGKREVELWGTGNVRREFLHSDDVAEALIFLLHSDASTFDVWENKSDQPPLVNIGCGEDITIKDLASLVAEVVGFEGNIVWDFSKPDGTPRKILDVSRMKKGGWTAKIPLKRGIASTYAECRTQWDAPCPTNR